MSLSACAQCPPASQLLGEEYLFQVLNESRLPPDVGIAFAAALKCQCPTTMEGVRDILSSILHEHSLSLALTGPEIPAEHRPPLVLRAQIQRNAQDAMKRGPAAVPGGLPSQGSSSPMMAELARKTRFSATLETRSGGRAATIWVGWLNDTTDLRTQLLQLSSSQAVSNTLALDWRVGNVSADVYLFRPGPDMKLQVPTLADALGPRRPPRDLPTGPKTASWHKFFVPAPPSWSVGMVRDLSRDLVSHYKDPAPPWAEAVMESIPPGKAIAHYATSISVS
jgi:hypothetical protein